MSLWQFNKIMAWANIFVVGFILAMVIWAMHGCKTAEPAAPKLVLKVCMDPVIETVTSEAWTEQDELAFQAAQRQCGKHYPNSPCLVRFRRIEPGNYHAICGGTTRADL